MPTADLLRDLIEKAGLSQRQAADRLGVSPRTFRDWCTGKGEPPKAIILALRYLAGEQPAAGDAE
jgi:transcriptional regulator with XRE-family HTH domain